MSNIGASFRQGGFSVLIFPLLLAIMFLIGAVVFGAWAYNQMQDYKNNVDTKVSVAVEAAKRQEDKVQANTYAEREKSPFRTYQGPGQYGSITIKYPKTWSAYVIDDRQGSPYVDGYFNPGVVRDIQSPKVAFPLRISVVSQTYTQALANVANYVKQGQAKVQPYTAIHVPNVIGVRIDGKLSSQKSGIEVVLPLRNTTLLLWTEDPNYYNDFTNIILPNFSFSP